QILRAELVHQKADGAAMHAVDRLTRTHMLVQRLQHQTVAAERHHDIGLSRIVIAVESDQLSKRLLGLRAGTRDEGDPVISFGRSHGIAGSSSARGQDRVRRGRLYDLGYPCRDSSPSRECHWTRRGTTLQSGYVDLLANNARSVAVLSYNPRLSRKISREERDSAGAASREKKKNMPVPFLARYPRLVLGL